MKTLESQLRLVLSEQLNVQNPEKLIIFKLWAMFQFRKENMLLSFERTIYITLLGMGCYFIYLGDVIGKFQARGTDFSTYKEPITELPTINMWFWPNLEDFKYGHDFNISLQANGKPKGINLTLGENKVPDAGLVMHFQDIYPPNNWHQCFENPRF